MAKVGSNVPGYWQRAVTEAILIKKKCGDHEPGQRPTVLGPTGQLPIMWDPILNPS